MKKNGIRPIPGMEIHHIDLDRSNNIPSNLFQTEKHKQLHDQLRFLMESWRFVSLKLVSPGKIVKYLLRNGDLVFEREYPRYRMDPQQGGALKEYEEILNDLQVFPAYLKPDLDIELAIAQFRLIPAARLFFERSVNENQPVRNATLHTTTKSTGLAEREREEDP